MLWPLVRNLSNDFRHSCLTLWTSGASRPGEVIQESVRARSSRPAHASLLSSGRERAEMMAYGDLFPD